MILFGCQLLHYLTIQRHTGPLRHATHLRNSDHIIFSLIPDLLI
ncbi:hypothetical protein BvCmsNSNP006_04827 [Escherichia coli]|nr:hypothetical protein BvCmsNSNP006_04827 [Escherichia coli]